MANLLFELASGLLKEHKRVRFRVKGGSMRPWIRDGDVIEIEPVSISDLRPGDVVFYRRVQGIKGHIPMTKSQISNSTKSLVAHRLIAKYHCYDGRVRLICQGDAIPWPDPEIKPDEVLGRVVAVNRDGRRITLRSPIYRLIGLGMIATLPLRGVVYLILRKV